MSHPDLIIAAKLTPEDSLSKLLKWAKAERNDWSERNVDRYWQMNRVIREIERLQGTAALSKE